MSLGLSLWMLLLVPAAVAQTPRPVTSVASAPAVSVEQLVTAIKRKAKVLENSSGMRLGFQAFTDAHHLSPDSVRYSDYVIVRLLYQATRDAGFWNVHWQITDQPPNSDRVWRQWSTVSSPSLIAPTSIAECDELSALFAFLVERAGVKSVGLFWPFANHTVAVWTVQPKGGAVIRVVVPTSQIFLEQSDDFDTKKFDPWRQRTIYEYTRRDAADSFDIPKSLGDFFLQQIDKYAGASDATLQRIRYLRDGVLAKAWTPEQAASEALKRRAALASGATEDAGALQTFADDMRRASLPR
ncbi:MAG TPA: hypothetical protein VMP12_04920 [Candidatus Sulfotelmatobacter sp.]|nr:hypothetical protein [Candidatus Sulfotelmatobacter sp.]